LSSSVVRTVPRIKKWAGGRLDSRRRRRYDKAAEGSMSAQRVRVGRAADVPVGMGQVFEAAGRTVAVFNVDGTFYAIDNECSHRGGPLGEGDLEGTVVVCPWHAWRWDVRTGANVNNPAVKVACYPVTEEEGSLFVDIGG
jgi:nitrite reductase/ring-hydroxylating ferredoxin subunit